MIVAIEINLPEVSEIFNSGCPIPIAPKGVKWSNSCLGNLSKEQGVYVIHHADSVEYVGKTDGPTMNFGERLRRHFQENASQNKHTYPKLSVLSVPPPIMVSCFTVAAIKDRIAISNQSPRRIDQLIALFEIVMINHLNPEYQQHTVNSVYRYVTKVMGTAIGQSITAEEVRKFMEERAQAKKLKI